MLDCSLKLHTRLSGRSSLLAAPCLLTSHDYLHAPHSGSWHTLFLFRLCNRYFSWRTAGQPASVHNRPIVIFMKKVIFVGRLGTFNRMACLSTFEPQRKSLAWPAYPFLNHNMNHALRLPIRSRTTTWIVRLVWLSVLEPQHESRAWYDNPFLNYSMNHALGMLVRFLTTARITRLEHLSVQH